MKTGLLIVVLCCLTMAACSPISTATAPTILPTALPPEPAASSTAAPTGENTAPPPTEIPQADPGATFTAVVVATPIDTAVLGDNSGAIIIDHRAVDLFDQIPDSAISSAADLRLMMRNASVGENISLGLDCLYGNYSGRRPSSCSDFYDLKYNRSNWDFQFRGNPGWMDKVSEFVDQTDAQLSQFEVFSFSVDYVDGTDQTSYPMISDPQNFETKFVQPLEALEAAHPEKTYILWTMCLARLSYENTQNFNDMLREYARANGKILFDLADIEAFDPQGNLTTDQNGREIIYQGYTDETQAGHLNETGRERTAKAFWYLMARVAGWEGASNGP